MLIWFSITNHPFWGTPIYGNIHINKHQQTGRGAWWIPVRLLDLPMAHHAFVTWMLMDSQGPSWYISGIFRFSYPDVTLIVAVTSIYILYINKIWCNYIYDESWCNCISARKLHAWSGMIGGSNMFQSHWKIRGTWASLKIRYQNVRRVSFGHATEQRKKHLRDTGIPLITENSRFYHFNPRTLIYIYI